MNWQLCSIVVLTVVVLQATVSAAAELFPLSIVHINDFHARFEPTDNYGGTCDPALDVCIGGYARTVHTVRRLLDELKDTNPIYLNAGDSFQGTLWYNVGRWNVTSQFLNILPAVAMTLGNHEFDHGVEGVVPFLATLNTTMLVANMDARDEPTLQGLYQNSMIIEKSNRKIGLIGVILETTYDLANTGNLIFANESDTIRTEAAKLKAEGANIIIVISHCGYDVDQEIARNAGTEIDVIVGAHSHTFLYTGDNNPGPDTPRGDYPTVVAHGTHRVLIVQAGAYAKYVGNITVWFDETGEIVDYEGGPIFMGADVPEDPEVVLALQPWKEEIDAIGGIVLGETIVDLVKAPCSSQECNLGNFFCDAMVHAFANITSYNQEAWTSSAIGLVNTGALRVPLTKGALTFSHMVTMSPFENEITAFSLSGDKLLEALEFSVNQIDLDKGVVSSSVFLQVAGLHITYDFTRPQGERVRDIKVRCATCDFPKYEEFEMKKLYRIVAPSFLVTGGDGFSMFRDHSTDIQSEMTDIEALMAYTKDTTPIFAGVEHRITVVKS